MKKRILSVLMILSVLLSSAGGMVFAEDKSSVTVSFTVQALNQFLCAPMTDVTVADDIAESYGYADNVTDGVSALDVLVKAHEEVFGSDFEDYLTVSESGWVTNAFGMGADFGFAVNGKTPHDNTLIESDYGDYYTGYTVNSAKISDNDFAEFFIYQNSYLDDYIWFEKDGIKLNSLSVQKDKETKITIKGYCIAYYGCNTQESIDSNTKAISGAQLCLVDSQTGEKFDIDGAVSDADGNVSFALSENGNLWLSAYIPDEEFENYNPVIMPLMHLTVDNNDSMSDDEAVSIIYDEFSSSGENKYNSSSKTPLEFPLEYNGETFTNIIDYIKAWALNETGREVNIKFDSNFPTTSYADWTSGSMAWYVPTAFDESGEMTQNYYVDNNSMAQRISNVYFTVGDVTSPKVSGLGIYGKVTSLKRSDEEIVSYVAKNLPFERICGKNESADKIVQELGEGTSSLSLPASDKLYTSKSAIISWSLVPDTEGDNALTLKNNKITVVRPNVGESDAKFTLKATVTSAMDEGIYEDVLYSLTVPAFGEVIVPIQVTSGAVLKLTDGYYKSEVDSKYIVKQENAPDGYDLYYCSLHTGATGTNQSFSYSVEKEGYITKSGSVSVGALAPLQPEIIDLVCSSENDTKLKRLEITVPSVKGFEFNPDVTQYNIEVNGGQYIKLSGEAEVLEASVKIDSYYKSLANANNGTLTTTGTKLTPSGVNCYLPDDEGATSDIYVTVTAPEGSNQEIKSRTYILHVKKTSANSPITSLTLISSSSGSGIKNNQCIISEETLSPAFVPGAREEEYYYTVNYFRDQIAIKITAEECEIEVNGVKTESGAPSDTINLNVGDNIFIITVTKDGIKTDYKLIVHRKAELLITDVKVTGGKMSTPLSSDGSNWTGSCNFANSAKSIYVTYYANISENVKIKVISGDNVYEGAVGIPIEIYVGTNDVLMPVTQIIYENGDYTESQGYIISFRRLTFDSPKSVESYLPAPGQFVNLESYFSPLKTLNGSGMITLGAFGGNVVYKYDEPIKNNPANPYGIDFIVMGNCFVNDDKTASPSAAEPAAVMVSKDGETWYELAGSEYYNASSRHNITVTYENDDVEFVEAADISWTNSEGESGVMPKNSNHNQPYYPNPSYYNQYQSGIGKNDSYTADKVSFTGTMIEPGFYPFGYADSHAQAVSLNNKAANPYALNHYVSYNGDGFDLDWAVDAEGNPVSLDEISYVKIYNPVLSYSTSSGEKSPEISAILRAQPMPDKVGVSGGLTGLTVNGQAVLLTEGVFTYDIDVSGASSLVITPTAVNPDANIYVSNQRVASGESTSGITAVKKLRVLVQEGEKEPVIYIINLKNVETDENNADLLRVVLTPGDDIKYPNENNEFAFTASSTISTIRLTPTAAGMGARVSISGKNINEPIQLENGETSPALDIDKGNNFFTLSVKSANGENTKEYTVNIYSEDSSSSTVPNMISVKFSMTGDRLHYNKNTNEYTQSHTNLPMIKLVSVKVPKGSTVKYLTEMMLNNRKIDYTSDGIYISEINGLAEFDNGPNSGWLYRHNGYIANEGYAERELSSGDVIKWFYTDDYTLESDYEGNFNKGSSSAVLNPKDDDKTNADNDAKVSNPFSDISEKSWYYSSVISAYNKGLIKGVSDTEFAPDSYLTRAMFVTILYRMENEPETNAVSFTDVLGGMYYEDAANWASANKIVMGKTNTEFAPDDKITREQMAAIIYRYAVYKGKTADISNGIVPYSDSESISDYAKDAVMYCYVNGLMKGNTDGTFTPVNSATRAEAAAVFLRLLEKLN